jgi:hypothetical protein
MFGRCTTDSVTELNQRATWSAANLKPLEFEGLIGH